MTSPSRRCYIRWAMAKPTREELFSDVVGLLNGLRDDWEYGGEFTPETGLIGDLDLESIDLVALGTAVEDKYRKQLPFAEFLASLEARNARDLTIKDILDFLEKELG